MVARQRASAEDPKRGPPRLGGPTLHQPLVTVVVVLAGGIALDRYVGLAFAPGWFLSAGCLAVWWLTWRRGGDSIAVAPLLAAVALAGASWHHARWHVFDRYEVARYADFDSAPAAVLAVAREAPERVPSPRATPLRAIPGNDESRLIVDILGIRDGTAWRAAAGQCLLSVEGHLLGIRPGTRLRAFGQLARPRPPLNPGEFDFASHRRADRELTRLRSSAPECVVAVRRAATFGPSSLLSSVRAAGKRYIRDNVGPERAGLASAILLGAREGLTQEDILPYVLTGTIHVLVVSGLNVAILATGLFALMQLGVVSRRTGLALTVAVIVLYTLVAESQPPVVRAAVLGVLMCLAAWIGRRGAAFNSLAGAALVVLAINPGDLFRTGPQLSFLAVATLIWVGHGSASWRQRVPVDRLDQLLAALRPWYVRLGKQFAAWAGWLMLTSLAVWLVTLPLVLNRFHVGSPIAVVISPAIWLVVFAAMWSGFAMLAVGWLIPPIAEWGGVICDQSLAGLDWMVGRAESLPGGHFWAPGPASWWVIGFYLGLLVVMVRGRSIAPPRWQWAALAAWILVGFAPALVRPWTRDALECSFVAVGHGTCVVLETPAGDTVLYDAGALGGPERATQSIAAYLWHRGIRRIDGVVISHADVDHYNALPGLLERFAVGAVYVSPLMFENVRQPGSGPEALRAAIESAGVPIHEIQSGDRLRVGPELRLQVLHPPRQGVVGSDNANSIVLAIEHAGRRLLLPGDLESPGLEDVMAELPYDCDVLLAPHHGSRRSDPPGFAAWSTPEWVVVSGGRDDDVGTVVGTYEAAGAHVVRTHLSGTVQFRLARSEINVGIWLGSPCSAGYSVP